MTRSWQEAMREQMSGRYKRYEEATNNNEIPAPSRKQERMAARAVSLQEAGNAIAWGDAGKPPLVLTEREKFQRRIQATEEERTDDARRVQQIAKMHVLSADLEQYQRNDIPRIDFVRVMFRRLLFMYLMAWLPLVGMILFTPGITVTAGFAGMLCLTCFLGVLGYWSNRTDLEKRIFNQFKDRIVPLTSQAEASDTFSDFFDAAEVKSLLPPDDKEAESLDGLGYCLRSKTTGMLKFGWTTNLNRTLVEHQNALMVQRIPWKEEWKNASDKQKDVRFELVDVWLSSQDEHKDLMGRIAEKHVKGGWYLATTLDGLLDATEDAAFDHSACRGLRSSQDGTTGGSVPLDSSGMPANPRI